MNSRQKSGLHGIKNDRMYHTSLWIIEDKETNERLGQSGIVLQNIEGQTELEIGYMLKKAAWGMAMLLRLQKAALPMDLKK